MILMCKPEHFDVSYVINPHMDLMNKPNPELAAVQWGKLVDTIRLIGCKTAFIQPSLDLPDLVFTANAGLFCNGIILSNFKYKERQPEKEIYKKWFIEHRYKVLELPEDVYFEGAGDALFANDILFCGWGFRSDKQAYSYPEFSEVQKCLCHLINPYFYHLDTCFCPLKNKDALIYKGAFDAPSFNVMNDLLDLIQVPSEEAYNFACNAVYHDNNIIMPINCPITKAKLEEKGYIVYEVEMSQYLKSGGAAKCLTLSIPN